MAIPAATPTPSHHRHRHPPAITAVQGIAGSIDRFGQSFGPILGGWLLDLVGQVALTLAFTLTLTLTLTLTKPWLLDLVGHARRLLEPAPA